MADEAKPQTTEQATSAPEQKSAGPEQVDLDAVFTQRFAPIKSEYEAEIKRLRQQYGTESTAWGAKFKTQAEQIAELKALADAAKLSADATDWVARRRNADREIAEAQELKAQLAQQANNIRTEKALLVVRRQAWAAKVPEGWFAKAAERMNGPDFVSSAELLEEARIQFGKDEATPADGKKVNLGPKDFGGGSSAPTITSDNADKLWLDGKITDAQYRGAIRR